MPGNSFAKGFEPPNQFGIPYQTYKAINLLVAKSVSKNTELAYVGSPSEIEVDASLGTVFFVTLDGNAIMGAPTNPTAGQRILFKIEQGAGSSTMSWNAVYRFSTDLPSPTLTTTIYYFDLIEFIYNEQDELWDCIRIVKGFDNTPA